MALLSDFGLQARIEYAMVDCTQVKQGRGHRYKVSTEPKPLTSVTTFTGVIDKGGGLMAYSRNMAAGRFRDKMLRVEARNLPGEDDYQDYIEEVYEYARKEDTTARDDGTAAHALIENALIGATHQVDAEATERVAPAVRVAIRVINYLGLETVGMSIPVWHPDEKFGGEIDYLGRDYTKALVILDWKRAGQLYDENALQVAAYSVCLNRLLANETGYPIAKVVRLPRTPDEEGEWDPRKDIKHCDVPVAYRKFLKTKDMFREMRHGESPWF